VPSDILSNSPTNAVRTRKVSHSKEHPDTQLSRRAV